MLTQIHKSFESIGAASADAYAAADPFPHIVFDDFLPLPILTELQDSFPGPASAAWGEYADEREVKLALRDEGQMPEPHVRMLRELNGQAFVGFLRALTGIGDLVPDPDYYGGGLHQIMPGGVLKVHADFNLHPVTRLQRRLNVLLYLNDDWDDSYGGQLELWDKGVTRAIRRISPVANRLVVFSTTSESFHGHPEPLACPPSRTRRSMAWYYYARPPRHIVEHVTLFRPRPGEAIYSRGEARRIKLEYLARKIKTVTPPSLVEGTRRLRGRS